MFSTAGWPSLLNTHKHCVCFEHICTTKKASTGASLQCHTGSIMTGVHMLTGVHTLNDSQSQQNKTDKPMPLQYPSGTFTIHIYPFNLKVCHPSCESLPPSCKVCTNDMRLVTHYCTPSCNVCTNNLRLVTHYCTPSCNVCTNEISHIIAHHLVLCTPITWG